MARIAVEGERSIYYEHYEGRGLPVILIHGWGMSCRVWDTTLVGLRDTGHAVLAFDQRGCGQSDKDFEESSIEASAGDVATLAKHLGLRRAVVNGWSMGGSIAVAAAAQLGSACAGVVLTAGASPRYTQAPDFPHGGPPGSAAQAVALLRADRANFLWNLTKAVCAVPQSPAVENWLWGMFMQAAPGADAALAGLDALDQRGILAELRVPLLSVVGGKDVVVPPEIGRSAAKLAPRGRVAEFDDCGHAPFLEDGPRYRTTLLEFLGSLE
jgi:pimeloyl-[acyl-carrier protein] methyl ester esterase